MSRPGSPKVVEEDEANDDGMDLFKWDEWENGTHENSLPDTGSVTGTGNSNTSTDPCDTKNLDNASKNSSEPTANSTSKLVHFKEPFKPGATLEEFAKAVFDRYRPEATMIIPRPPWASRKGVESGVTSR